MMLGKLQRHSNGGAMSSHQRIKIIMTGSAIAPVSQRATFMSQNGYLTRGREPVASYTALKHQFVASSLVVTQRRKFSVQDDGKSDAEVAQSDAERAMSDIEEAIDRELEPLPDLSEGEAMTVQDLQESMQMEGEEALAAEEAKESGEEAEGAANQVVEESEKLIDLFRIKRKQERDDRANAAIYQREFDAINDARKVMRGLDQASQYSDLEGVIAQEQNLGKVGILKQMLNNPDFTTREGLLQSASPKPVSDVQAQKEEALHKLAAYNKSADILKLIKQKMGDDPILKRYLVQELKKSGSDFGSFVADSLQISGQSSKEIRKKAKKYSESLQAESQQRMQSKTDQTIDQYTLGITDQYNGKPYVPSNEQDRFERHVKTQIQTFDQYVEYLKKIGLEKSQVADRKLKDQLKELYDRYEVPEDAREYQLKANSKESLEQAEQIEENWSRLAEQIPELRVMLTAPTIESEIRQQMLRTFRKLDEERAQVDEARASMIEKQLQELKPQFEAETKNLNEAEKAAAWQQITDRAYAPTDTGIKDQMTEILDSSQGQTNAFVDMIPGIKQSAAEIMQENKYQAINLPSSGPLEIDRVTRDGPRDLVGEVQQLLKSGPAYDLRKSPDSGLQNTEAEPEVISQQQAHRGENPVDHYLNNVSQLRQHLEINYEYAKRVESAIDSQRRKVASDMLNLQSRLSNVLSDKDNLQTLIVNQHQENVSQQVQEPKAFDFIELSKNNQGREAKKLLEQELKQLLSNKTKLSENATDAKAYEDELKVLSCHALLNQALKKPNDQLGHFAYVLDLMSQNKVRPTVQIEARSFEYAVLGKDRKSANGLLSNLTKDRTEKISPIDTRYLQKFFTQCLKTDNLDGIAHLVNYCNRYSVDTSSYPVEQFRGALDHYLNRQFDLSKVMIFVKFYQRHIADRARSAFDQVDPNIKDLPDSTILGVSKQIYGASEGLVDFTALTDYLVDQVGSRQVLDPFTKKDSLWGLIESQTCDQDFISAAQMSPQNGLSGRTVARYIGNQLSRPSSFDRTFKSALRLQGTPMADDFFAELMQQMSRYKMANNNQIPTSFTKQKLADLYVRIKLSRQSLSPAMSELVLFCLNAKGMNKEIVDMCSTEEQTEIQKYYLAEALFSGRVSAKSYSDALLSSQNFSSRDGADDLSACQVTQRTKALFLDGQDQGAIDFLRAELAKRENRAKDRKDLMVALYDSVMASGEDGEDSKMTFAEFKKKHESSAILSRKLLQQAFAVKGLQRIVKSNDYDGINDAFSLFMLLRQERDITGLRYTSRSSNNYDEQVVKLIRKMSASDKAQLEQIQARKATLMQKVHAEDYQRLREIIEITDDEKLDDVEGLQAKKLKQVLGLFHDMTFDEASYSMAALGKASEKKQKLPEAVTTPLQDIVDVQEDQNWLQMFFDRKQEVLQDSIREMIQFNSQPIEQARQKLRGDKSKPASANQIANQAFVEDILDQRISFQGSERGQLSKSRQAYRAAIQQTQDQLKKNKASNPDDVPQGLTDYILEKNGLEEEEDDAAYEEATKKQQWLFDNLEPAFDENKEALIELHTELYAKRQVLLQEAAKNRFADMESVTALTAEQKREMHNYAKAIFLIRLQIKQMMEGKNDLQQAIKKENVRNGLQKPVQELHDILYARVSRDQRKSADAVKMSETEKKLDKHFNVDFNIHFENTVLPNSSLFNRIEKEARQAAEDELRGDEEQDELGQILDMGPDSKKKGFLGKSKKAKAAEPKVESTQAETQGSSAIGTNWIEKFEQIESEAFEKAVNHYYMGDFTLDREAIKEKYGLNPRELIQVAMEAEEKGLESDDEREFVAKKLGLEDAYKTDSDYDSGDEQDEEDRAERLVNKHYDEWESKQNSLILRNPLEHFVRKRLMNHYHQARYIQNLDEDDDEKNLDEEYEAIRAYNRRMTQSDIDPNDNYDPINYERKAHDTSLLELRENLTKAVSERKAEALPIAISIFNRLQDKVVKTKRLEDQDATQDPTKIESINQSLERLDILLNDRSSPLISTLASLSKYASQKLPESLEAYRATVQDGDIINEAVDLNRMINDYRSLNLTEDKLKSMGAQIDQLEVEIKAKQNEVGHEIDQQAYQKWVQSSKDSAQLDRDNYLQKLYDQYLVADLVTDDLKVRLMRDVFAVQLGERFVNAEAERSDSSYPAFYAQDLIRFGLQKEIPAAVRLGELLMSEYCPSDARMPQELSRAVRDFMIDNQDKYQAAAKYTGPINATQIYHQARQSGSAEQPVFMNVDDPYMHQFQRENYRREDNWRLPSIHAWDHKPYGIFGEILDLKRFETSMQDEQQMKM